MESFEGIDLSRDDEEEENVPIGQEPLPNSPKSPRNYAQLKAEFKKGKGVRLTKEESKIYWRGKLEDAEAEKRREEVAMERFWGATNRLTRNLLTKILFYAVYGLWTATPIAGIVIGLIYIRNEHCPGQPSIAPLLIILGLMSILVGFSLVSQQKTTRKENTPTTPIPKRSEEYGDGEEGILNGNDLAQVPPPLPAHPLESEDLVLGPSPEETYTLAQTMGVCAGGFLVCFIVVFKFVHLILFIATSVIVYRFSARVQFSKGGLNEEEVETLYCNEVLFWFAFGSVTLALGILGLLLLCCFCGCCIFVAWTTYASREPPQPVPTSSSAA